jgi:hypothetical protein
VSLIKRQTRDLSRIRQNQQRSRERKRAYVAELEAKIAHLLAQDTSDQTTRNKNDARRQFLQDLGIADSAQERYIQTYVARLTPSDDDRSRPLLDSVGSSNNPVTVHVNTGTGPSQEAINPLLHVSTPNLESTAIESPVKAFDPPFHPEDEALFKDPRSQGLLDPLPIFPTADFYPGDINLTFNNYGTDGTTACPIAYRLLLQNNARCYSIATLESKLLAGYQTAGNDGDSCRILNKVLFAVLAEISRVRGTACRQTRGSNG